jgi:GTP-binding protein
MKFIDEAIIEVIAGNGGNGCVSFRREKYVPRGGPNGGDGGKGGDIVFIADEGLGTLMHVQYRRRFSAKKGSHGMGSQKTGAQGEDKIVKLPVGTLIYDADSNELLHDLKHRGDRFIAANGGKGGRGNMHFSSATNQAPRQAEPGEKGVERKLRLELKLLADVGLVGFPNSGKSTLISTISNSRPKIADYPFTTKVPNLGVVQADDRSFVVADIPGLIEGAHRGAGMGVAFLRHIERTKLLVYLIDMSDVQRKDPVESFKSLREELHSFNIRFDSYPEILVLTKTDLPEVRDKADDATIELTQETSSPIFKISAATGDGLEQLIRAMAKNVFL